MRFVTIVVTPPAHTGPLGAYLLDALTPWDGGRQVEPYVDSRDWKTAVRQARAQDTPVAGGRRKTDHDRLVAHGWTDDHRGGWEHRSTRNPQARFDAWRVIGGSPLARFADIYHTDLSPAAALKLLRGVSGDDLPGHYPAALVDLTVERPGWVERGAKTATGWRRVVTATLSGVPPDARVCFLDCELKEGL